MFVIKPFVNPEDNYDSLEEEEEGGFSCPLNEILESEGSVDPKKIESEQNRIHFENTIKQLKWKIEKSNKAYEAQWNEWNKAKTRLKECEYRNKELIDENRTLNKKLGNLREILESITTNSEPNSSVILEKPGKKEENKVAEPVKEAEIVKNAGPRQDDTKINLKKELKDIKLLTQSWVTWNTNIARIFELIKRSKGISYVRDNLTDFKCE
ncbi:unnamed protein product [Blepharisma stoltei]|uniref:Uncharacterized protein n=1 Tax=Blepharisma stoltei TaxID=1481888 RepID=A0AAU9J571_9CILI|nr:unnamed protein product [Blepharisma stoltei]